MKLDKFEMVFLDMNGENEIVFELVLIWKVMVIIFIIVFINFWDYIKKY